MYYKSWSFIAGRNVFIKQTFYSHTTSLAKDDHQLKNANFYEGKGCCWVLDQKTLSHDKLLEFLLNILNNKSALFDKKSNLKKLNYNNSWLNINQKLLRVIDEN